MSYAQGGALQAAVFAVVSGDGSVQSLIGANVFDAPPGGVLPQTYVVLGEEDAKGRRNGSVEAALHEFTVTVISDATGFALAKAVAEAVSDALLGASLVLARGRVVDLAFLRARARRGKSPESRRVDLRFRAWVEDI